jgi:low affinity Fe/Cu permease
MASHWFNQASKKVSRFTGGAVCFCLAIASVLGWLASGPAFRYSDTWQLVMNTGTSIVTFLMVFLIQNSQYRDTEAIQIKLDELIRATEGARNTLLGLEELDPEVLARLRDKYTELAERAKNPHDKAVTVDGVEKVAVEEVVQPVTPLDSAAPIG